jgi:hypothetical protein
MKTSTLSLLCTFALAGCGLDQGKPTYATSRSNIQQACPSTPAPALFTNGMCICEDFDSVGDLIVRASGSGAKAHVGVNGVTNLVGTPRIDGSMVAYRGLSGVGEAQVTGDLATTTSLDGVGTLEVGGNLDVGGDLSSVGQLTVGGEVRVAGKFEMTGDQALGGLAAYQAPALPCACGAADRLDVVAEVARAKAKHDNESAGLPSLDLLGEANLKLGTGRYYFAGVSTLGDTTIEVSGAVVIYVDGDLDSVGAQNLVLAPGATLDLLVAGDVNLVGDTNFGGEPGRFRLYVGGNSPVAVAVGDQTFRGSLYAAEAEVSFVGDTKIEGALFAKSLSGVGTLEIVQAESAVPSPTMCGGPVELAPAAADASTPSEGGVSGPEVSIN